MEELKIENLRQILRGLGAEPSGPIYKSTHKHLAKILFNAQKEEEAIYHLSESHGPTLRNRMVNQLKHKFRQSPSFDGMLDRIQFGGSFHNGFVGLQQRLAELPKEWAVVQLTLEWDPLSRFPCRNNNVNRGLGTYITRFACGKSKQHRKGDQPFLTFLPALDDGEDRPTFMTAIRNYLSRMNEDRADRRKAHNECSQGIEATVNDVQMWLGGWICLFMGRLASEKLEHAVKAAIDSFISSYNSGDSDRDDVPEKNLNILYLLASSPSIAPSEVQKVVCSIFKDQKFANYLVKKVCDVKSNFSSVLQRVERHPVILLVDEEMDILPFEVLTPIQDQSFARMPSIHFLHSLYHYHKDSALKKGVNTDNCYYVINPSQNLPNLVKLYESISTIPSVQKWEGVYNTAPTTDQFLNGLKDYDLFVYCGHGDGRQFLNQSIDVSVVKASVFLFGCSSSSLNHPGGRMEMSSTAYTYLISGSPSVVGMLWPVLDTDINSMTESLVKSWYGSGSQKGSNNMESLETDLKNMNINTTQSEKPSRDLGKAVCNARKTANRFLNKAAFIIRGLPLNAI